MTARRDGRKGWVVDFIYRFPDGRKERVRRTSPVQTKRGAEAYERLLREEMLDPPQPREEVPTFNRFADEFLATYVKSNNKKSTEADKTSVLKVHLRPTFGKLWLDEIDLRRIERFKAKLVEKVAKPKTANNILAVLNKLLSYAVEVGVLESKPRIRLFRVPPTKFDFLDFEEWERLVAVLDLEPLWGPAILAAGEGGFRLGEILGMWCEDMDHVAGVITVRRALWRDHLGSPKGHRERKVPMTRRLAARLKEQRHLKGKFMWSDDEGEPLTKKMAQRALERCCRRAGLRRIGWHKLRHTFCSHLAMRGAAPKAIQELAGHRDITTTMKYMHLASSALHEAIGLLEPRTDGDKLHGRGTYVAPG